jgi:predicted ATPase/class 3 adenylate cyclase
MGSARTLNLALEARPEADRRSATGAARGTETPVRCTLCSTENPAENRFCEQCGAGLSAECPACGRPVRAGARFCGGCGGQLGREGAPAESPPPPAGDEARRPYTPRHLAEKILTTRSAVEGERRVVTVLFADCVGFTSIAEKLDPEDVHRIMERCFERMAPEIHRLEGTINQYRGDGVMALFGAPIAHEDGPRRAVHAALGIQRALGEYADELEGAYGFRLRMRIGLNTGTVVVGRIGDDLRMDYTADGDTTNVASRLESLCPPGSVLVSESTHRAIDGFFETRDLGELQVKGHAAPVRAYEVLRAHGRQAQLEVAAERGLTPLVGRERELAQLEDLFRQAKSGRGQVVFLTGEAGIGKSRLVYELRRRLAEAGERAALVEGRCVSFGRSIPFLPLIEQLRASFGIEEVDGEPEIVAKVESGMRRMGEVEEHIPFIRYLLAVDPGDESILALEASARRKGVFDALIAVAQRGASRRPIIFVFEDIHWIDTSTEDYLRRFFDTVATSSILVIATFRLGYQPPFGTRSFHTTINVRTLSEADALAMAGRVLDVEELPEGVGAALLGKAEGVPLFVEEVAKTLVDLGILRREGARYRLVMGPEAVSVPQTIQDIIMARLDRLGEEGKRTVQLAAVIGRQFLVRLLERVAGLTGKLEGLLEELKALEIIYQQGLLSEPAYVFKHAVIQDVAYNSLLRERRKQLHAAVAEAIEALYADRLPEHHGELAHHCAQAERWADVLRYASLAGESAVHAFANAEAKAYRKLALEAAQRLASPLPAEELAQLHAQYAAVLTTLGDFDESAAEYRLAVDLARESGDRHRETEYRMGLSGVYNYSHRGDPAMEHNEEALACARELGDRALIAACLANKVQILSAGYGKIAESMADAEEAARLSAELGDRPLLAITNTFLGGAFVWRGDFDRGLRYVEQAAALSEATHQGFAYGYACFMAGHGCAGKGEYEKALAWYRKLDEYAIASGDTFWVARSHNPAGGVHLELFDLEVAFERNLEGAEAARRVWPWPEPQAHAYLKMGLVHFLRGDHGGAQAEFRRAWEMFDADVWYRWRWHIPLARAEGELALREGRIDDAWRRAAESLEVATRTDSRKHVVRALCLQGEILAASGQLDEAIAHLADATSLAERLGARPDLWRCCAVLGRVRVRRGDDAGAEAAFRRAVETIETITGGLETPGLRRAFLAAEPVAAIYRELGRTVPSPLLA